MFKCIQEYFENLSINKKIHHIVCLDESQYLNSDILRDLKMLTNFSMDSKNCFSLVLLGQNVNSFYEAINNNKNSILIIDLRDDDDYERGHIGQAINLPYNDDGEYMLTYLNKNNYQNKEIYLICYSGNRATKAFNLLFASDYKNINYLTFGYEEFIENVGSDFSPAVGECNCKAN
mgnify:CR=1 FL=1|jgi:rhodanese-related sulfurtransferase